MRALEDKRRCREPDSDEGVEPAHPEPMERINIAHRRQHNEQQTCDRVIPSNDWLCRTEEEGGDNKPNSREDINATGDVNLAKILP